MVDLQADVAILGSGFAGSLCGMILARCGLNVVVVDRAAHPRFAIGESSTPIANFVLRDLARRHDLAALLPLTKYGPWQRQYPNVVSGLKRGFSYFPHEPHREFVPCSDHSNELLVAASLTDEQSDTHWLRADVDQLFASELVKLGARLLERTTLSEITPPQVTVGKEWSLRGERQGEAFGLRCRFVIDATGEAGVLAKTLGIRVSPDRLFTRSRGVFSHFRGMRGFDAWLRERGGACDDHPFCCDDAAQHQLMDGAWMWVLRFNNGVTSAGFAIDAERFPIPDDLTAEQEWHLWLDRYPSVRALFDQATIVDPPGKILRSGVLPRRADRAVGPHWAMLPHTAGFIDPLHSSGIAHSLCGIERLTRCLVENWNSERLHEALQEYERAVFGELHLIDRLVHGCYRTLADFRLFVPYSMLYFAAATWYERQRIASQGEMQRWFLNADDQEFCRVIEGLHERVVQLTDGEKCSDEEAERFSRELAAAIQPYNVAGLCDPAVRNMYRYTAPPSE